MRFNTFIKQFRKKNNLTQENLMVLLGLTSRKSICNMESGEVNPKLLKTNTLIRLSELTHIPVEDIKKMKFKGGVAKKK